ncbi:hypothetical protein B0A55_03445 [Friedmanniomyces simplex]|uniref:EH domain-containing protein n=1 Tax=Friedmanniomyces simplex TaxID=329884 RepID=A0A4U0XQ44_9PEZI|nr:hypothetical protein B0A55_03445 [Friedmanniomyces simplex]
MRSPKPVRDGGITSVFQMELGENEAVPKPAADIAANDYEPMTHATQFAPYDPEERLTCPERGFGCDQPRKQASSAVAVSPPTFINPAAPDPEAAIAEHDVSGEYVPNAIVASSLASSRAPSPRKVDPPPVPIRNPRHHKLGFSRTPSPTKHSGMRHTLRKEESEDSDSEVEQHPYGKHKKKRIVRKHPNKHHEGDRKRWREAVTERERKRYEGVWAANKGMHCSFTPEEEQRFRRAPNAEATVAKRGAALEQVSNIVTRDIWARSRLPDAVLETVWDLVDSESVGRLSKEEFVVGMWLIDQRLKGRKLPVKVTATVWQSVRGLQGIKIRKQ